MTKEKRALILTHCFLVFFSVMNGSIFNVSLPYIAMEFQLMPSEVSWIVVGYMMTFAISTATFGKLADLYPVKRLITIGLIIFAAGSLVGYSANQFWMVIVGRVIQASGAGAIPALGMIIATRFFESKNRGHALGFISSAVAVGSAMGPVLGGFIAEYFGWSMLFFVSVGSLLGLPIMRKLLPDEETRPAPFDLVGLALFSLTISSLFLGINWSSWALLGFILLGTLFVLHSRRITHPFINPRFFTHGPYVLILAMGFAIFMCMSIGVFLLPLMLEEANSLPESEIGLVLFPGAILSAFLGSTAGKWSDHFGSPTVIRMSSLLMLVGYLLFSTFVGVSPIFSAIFFLLVYVGFSSNQSALSNYTSQNLPPGGSGVGMGLFSMSNFLGNAMGPALIGDFLEKRMDHWNPLYTTQFTAFSNSYLLIAIAMGSIFFLLPWIHYVKQQSKEGVRQIQMAQK
ncbi:MFS transporter [Risungbinella massiliensis]|uniref:MFS transporter n=1 Tax=Risungbinella massiliensis TaxID=1329796 RepID=UPI0005CBAFFC|nr:MFS transporter [Risungbinella massiliensis]